MSTGPKIGKGFLSWGAIEQHRHDTVTIGDYVVLGGGSTIITHCPISYYKEGYEINIGNNVFIGKGCLILPGANIGDNVMIGAGSVVRGKIEENSIAYGNPCKVRRKMTDLEARRMKLMTAQCVVGDGTEPDWGEDG